MQKVGIFIFLLELYVVNINSSFTASSKYLSSHLHVLCYPLVTPG